MIFKKNENFAARARPNLPIFGNWTHKNIPDHQHSARFRKSQKVLYLSTLAYILHSSRRKPEFGCQRTKLSENFSSWHWRHFPTAAPPAKMWGGGRERLRNFQISRVELSSFLLFLGVRGASSKTIKTGLNCWQNCRRDEPRILPFSNLLFYY